MQMTNVSNNITNIMGKNCIQSKKSGKKKSQTLIFTVVRCNTTYIHSPQALIQVRIPLIKAPKPSSLKHELCLYLYF